MLTAHIATASQRLFLKFTAFIAMVNYNRNFSSLPTGQRVAHSETKIMRHNVLIGEL